MNGRRSVTLDVFNENGVSRIFLSLDGTNFTQYIGMLEIDPNQHPTITAFVDDSLLILLLIAACCIAAMIRLRT